MNHPPTAFQVTTTSAAATDIAAEWPRSSVTAAPAMPSSRGCFAWLGMNLDREIFLLSTAAKRPVFESFFFFPVEPREISVGFWGRFLFRVSQEKNMIFLVEPREKYTDLNSPKSQRL